MPFARLIIKLCANADEGCARKILIADGFRQTQNNRYFFSSISAYGGKNKPQKHNSR